MRNMIQLFLISILTVGTFGCSTEASVPAIAGRNGNAVVIPSRTLFKVTLIDGLHSETSSGGDTFLASLAEPIVINGATVLEQGTILSGRVLDSVESGLVYGQASLRFALTAITNGDHTVPMTTNTFAVTTASSGKRNIEVVAGGAGVSADTGKIGKVSNRGEGAGFAFSSRGKEIDYGPGTRLNFTLVTSIKL